MDIRQQDIDYRKVIGTLDGTDVLEVALKGGLHLVCQAKRGKLDFLGVGPHRAVARYMAKKRHSRIKLTDLAKGDYVAPEHFMHLLPRWEATLDRMVVASKG